MEPLLLVVLIVLNGFFAMSEIALVSARRARLQPLAEAGDPAARLAVQLGSEPTRFLSTVQIGITSIALLSGIVGEATLAPPLAARFESWGASEKAAMWLATGLVVAMVTYFAIVVGELVPKRIGQIHAERIARIVAWPIQWITWAAQSRRRRPRRLVGDVHGGAVHEAGVLGPLARDRLALRSVSQK